MKRKSRQRFTAAVTAVFVVVAMVTSCNYENPEDTHYGDPAIDQQLMNTARLDLGQKA